MQNVNLILFKLKVIAFLPFALPSLSVSSLLKLPNVTGNRRPNVSKYPRSISDGFLYALEVCLVNSELS